VWSTLFSSQIQNLVFYKLLWRKLTVFQQKPWQLAQSWGLPPALTSSRSSFQLPRLSSYIPARMQQYHSSALYGSALFRHGHPLSCAHLWANIPTQSWPIHIPMGGLDTQVWVCYSTPSYSVAGWGNESGYARPCPHGLCYFLVVVTAEGDGAFYLSITTAVKWSRLTSYWVFFDCWQTLALQLCLRSVSNILTFCFPDLLKVTVSLQVKKVILTCLSSANPCTSTISSPVS